VVWRTKKKKTCKQSFFRMPGITSASGLLSLLDEHEDDKLKVYALEKLNTVVDQFWAEIADNIQQM